MDGQRPMEELSNARNVSRVLDFLGQKNTEFMSEKIIDLAGTSVTTVVRALADNSDDLGLQKLSTVRDIKDWRGLFAGVLPTVESENPKDTAKTTPDLQSSPKVDANIRPKSISKLMLVILRPGDIKTRPQPYCESFVVPEEREEAVNSASECKRELRTASRVRLNFRDLVNLIISISLLRKKTPPQKEVDSKDLTCLTTGSLRDNRRKLKNIPLALDTFQFVTKMMSCHSWVLRLISRANVPVFERTVIEMPLHLSNGQSMGAQRAIVYNCRTTNDWEDDMALTVTHFPKYKLTFAVLFGASEENEVKVLKRLKRAGADTAHPMLLPGILAELERARQLRVAEEMIEELEAQIVRLDSETIAGWQQDVQTKAERNKRKTKALLDTAYAKNLLLANAALLSRMCGHLEEFSLLANSATRRYRYICQRNHQNASPMPFGLSMSQPWASARNSWPIHSQASYDSEHSMISDPTLVSEPEPLNDPEAKYQEALRQAGMRMNDRLVSMTSEYEEKIRACTMEVEGIKMATQWSHGETNMEIATASGEDSSQMRSIALVTMVFLPGTFFASMFSMTFFNWGGDGGSGSSGAIVSPNIWIYVVVTVLSTSITLLLFWYFILSRQRNRRKFVAEVSPA